MKIFYFNITYTCNSNCVFCFSHNTIHSGLIHNEISPTEFFKYLSEQNVHPCDRVIINGGEPFLHSDIMTILKTLKNIGCEVLIYTNGRLLKNLDFSFMTERYRFVIPVHGHKTLHDRITRIEGSFDEMMEGLKHLSAYRCRVDIKIILNPLMISSSEEFDMTLHDIDSLVFNNAIHITKMADTIISKKNCVPSMPDASTAKFNMILFKHFEKRNVILKFFDTCVKEIPVFDFCDKVLPHNVYFKDAATQWDFSFYTPHKECEQSCSHRKFCQSAIGNYTVLEYNGKFYKDRE